MILIKNRNLIMHAQPDNMRAQCIFFPPELKQKGEGKSVNTETNDVPEAE